MHIARNKIQYVYLFTSKTIQQLSYNKPRKFLDISTICILLFLSTTNLLPPFFLKN